jgi:hypothetical protein
MRGSAKTFFDPLDDNAIVSPDSMNVRRWKAFSAMVKRDKTEHDTITFENSKFKISFDDRRA